MKKIKKLTARAGIIVLLIAVCSLLIVSCGDSGLGDNSSSGHTHDWGWKVTSTVGAGLETETCSICSETRNTRYINKVDEKYQFSAP